MHNVAKSSKDKRKPNWLKAFLDAQGYKKCSTCYIEEANPKCGHTNPLKGNLKGGHVWNKTLSAGNMYYSILPIYKRHNKRVMYDKQYRDGTGWLLTKTESYALKITSSANVPGWKGMVNKLIGVKSSMKLATAMPNKADLFE